MFSVPSPRTVLVGKSWNVICSNRLDDWWRIRTRNTATSSQGRLIPTSTPPLLLFLPVILILLTTGEKPPQPISLCKRARAGGIWGLINTEHRAERKQRKGHTVKIYINVRVQRRDATCLSLFFYRCLPKCSVTRPWSPTSQKYSRSSRRASAFGVPILSPLTSTGTLGGQLLWRVSIKVHVGF